MLVAIENSLESGLGYKKNECFAGKSIQYEYTCPDRTCGKVHEAYLVLIQEVASMNRVRSLSYQVTVGGKTITKGTSADAFELLAEFCMFTVETKGVPDGLLITMMHDMNQFFDNVLTVQGSPNHTYN